MSDIEYNERIKKVSFDPTGRKVAFTILELDAQGKEPTSSALHRFSINILHVAEDGNTLNLRDVGRVTTRLTPEVYWSNSGVFFVLANTDTDNPNQGYIEFCSLKPIANAPFLTIESIK